MMYYEQDYLVRSYECDTRDCVKLSTLVNYMQDMAGFASSAVGLGYQELFAMNLAWILYKWKIRIYQYPKVGSIVRVRTWSSHIDKLYAHRCFSLLDADGNVIGEAFSVWVLLDFENRCVARIPQEIMEAYPSTEETVSFADEFTNNPIPSAGSLLSQRNFTIPRHDLDSNLHLNNVKYIDYLLSSVPQDLWDNKQVYDLEVTYKKECRLGDTVTCLCFDSIREETKEGTTVIALIKPIDEENNRRAHTVFQLKFK